MIKILVVEDSAVLNKAYERILSERGHTVITAVNGKEALEKLKTFEPNLILLDLLMPEMGGIDFLKQYDVINNHPETHVIVISNMENDKEVAQARQLGAKRYILKSHATPLQLSVLVDKVAAQKLETT